MSLDILHNQSCAATDVNTAAASFRKMLKLRELKSLHTACVISSKRLSTHPAANPNDEYTDKPEYPKILDLSYKARKRRQSEAWHEQVKNVTTIEGKLIKVNMPRYYGFRCVMLGDQKIPYNSLPIAQHYTRTLFESSSKLPEQYDAASTTVESFAKSIEASVQDVIGFATLCYRQKVLELGNDVQPADLDRLHGSEIVSHINRFLLQALRDDCPHLADVEVDLEPRHEAFWFVGGIQPPERVRKFREGLKWQKDFVEDPVDRAVQFIGRPYLALRHREPLRPIRPMQQETKETLEKVPLFKYDARTVGITTTHRHGTTIPGFWPGSPYEFGLLSYQCRDFLLRNPNVGPDKNVLLHTHAIQSSFAWLLAQACYQGFSTYTDLTYPLSTQTVITNGQLWSFYVYQMNTTTVHSDCVYNNPKVNYCWGTDEMKLYETVDETGKCIGFNEDVLKNLLHFYANAPAERTGCEMKPYLAKTEQKVADIKDDKRRTYLERIFKHLMANRPRHRLVPEIYLWEKIYKIDNKTRQMEPRRRFFELGVNPFKRRLDEHIDYYIPRDKRPLGRRSKIRFEDKYYP